MFIDAHTHHKSIASNQVCLVMGEHSLGVHPWELLAPFSRNDFDQKWEQMIQTKKEYWVVGECGLDRIREGIAGIEDQKYVLLKHFELAEEKECPIVLHSVRAISDFLEILKKRKLNHSILFHDFSGNQHEIDALLKFPVYFSFGHRIFKDKECLKKVPLEKILFETDDQKEHNIEAIYQQASAILHIPIEALEKLIEKNFLAFFDQLDNISPSDFINNFRR